MGLCQKIFKTLLAGLTNQHDISDSFAVTPLVGAVWQEFSLLRRQYYKIFWWRYNKNYKWEDGMQCKGEEKKCDNKMGSPPNTFSDFKNFFQNPNWANRAILKSDCGIWRAPVLKPELPNGPLHIACTTPLCHLGLFTSCPPFVSLE